MRQCAARLWRSALALGLLAALGACGGDDGDGDPGAAAGWTEPVALVLGLERPTALGQGRSHLVVADEQGLVWLVPKAGGQAVISAESLGAVPDLVVRGEVAFWLDGAGGRLWTMSLATREPQLLALVPGSPKQLAVDDQHVYLLDDGGTVRRVSREQGLQELFYSWPEQLADLALDSERLYLTAQTVAEQLGVVLAVSLLEGTAEQLAAGQDQPSGVAVDGERIYWATASAIMSADLSSDEDELLPEVLAQGLPAPRGLTAAGGYLYWTCAALGSVARVPKPGGPVETIATGQDQPLALVVDSQAAYWINQGTGRGSGSLVKSSYSR